MTSHDTPTPEALQITVPHFSLQALTHLIAAITPLLPPAPKRGPKGMAITTRVRLALSYLREGVSIRGLARISGIPVTTLRDNIGPILEAFDRLAPLLPDGTIIGDFDDIAWWCAETGGTIIVDGTELAIARPTGQVEQRPYYSGKKKTHTLKTIAVCDAESNLLWVTPLLGGATHDLTALRDANFPSQRADSGLDVLADSGFQGLQHDVEAVELPTRRPRDNSELTKADRFFNSVLSSNRVRVEHSIGRLKQWRCLTVPKQHRALLERWLPVCWALTSFQQAWPRS